nr:hypothetical protein [Tanacetum cinerariifolium]
MEDTILELVKIYRQKELLCMHDNVDDLIESALNSKLLSSNSQCLDKEEQEVKNVVEQPAECGTRINESLQNFRVIHKNSISLNNTSQISPVHAVAPILSTKKPEYSPSMGDVDSFEDIEYVEASLSDLEIFRIEEENVVQQEKEVFDLEDVSQIQDIVLQSDNSLLDNFSPEFKTFCDHTEETRSGNTTHADNSLPKYDSFCFKIELDQERLINVVKNDIPDDSSNDLLLEEADLFLASDNSIPPGIENIADDSEGDVRFLEELLIDDSILSNESSDSNFKDNPSFPRPPPKPPDAETDAGEEIPVVMSDKDKFNEDYYFFMFDKVFSLLSAKSEDMIFDPVISA